MTERPKKPDNWTSHTELSKLSHCEMSWKLRYLDGIKGDGSDAMRLGTLVHAGAAAMNLGEDWRAALAAGIAEEGADASLVDLEALDAGTPGATAAWLLERYERFYGAERGDLKVVATELDLTATLPGTDQVHQAIIDEVWEDWSGQLWVVERKTYGRTDRLAFVEVDPQLTLNLWVAQQNGIPAVGIVFDGIYTYRWKLERPTLGEIEEKLITCGFQGTKKDLRQQARDVQAKHPGTDRPDADSFTRLWLDRSEAHIEAALDDVLGSIERRQVLREGGRPIRNIGTHCSRCDQRTKCWEMLAFSQDIELSDD